MDIIAREGRAIPIGRLGENKHIRILFSVNKWTALYPDATFTLLNRLPDEDVAYPVPTVTREGQYVCWTVTNADLTKDGRGRCELIITRDDIIAKSVRYVTEIRKALDGSGKVPDGWETWQQVFAQIKDDTETAARQAEAALETVHADAETASEKAAEASQSATEAELASQGVQNMTVDAETLGEGEQATVTKNVDPQTGVVTLEFGIPRGNTGATGPQGIPGVQGEPGYTPVRGTDYWTTEDQNTIIDAASEAASDAAREAARHNYTVTVTNSTLVFTPNA